MIRTDGLMKSYGARRAVDGLSFEVPGGTTFGLLGPNGAGKTTTIRMLSGVLAPDAGTIWIDGEEDPTRPAVRRLLGGAPQALALYERLTGEENVRFFGQLYGLRGAALRARTDAVLALAGLTDRRADRVEGYSGGMKRRLNLACALVHDPPVLLLDEPTVGVDPQSREAIFTAIEALRDEGRTLLYTTHYMEEAERLCDRVAIMDGGRILAEDTVAGLIATHGSGSTIVAELDRAPEPPPPSATVEPTADGVRLRQTTDDAPAAVTHLASHGLRSLTIERPSLGAVFLALTGRRLRDDPVR